MGILICMGPEGYDCQSGPGDPRSCDPGEAAVMAEGTRAHELVPFLLPFLGGLWAIALSSEPLLQGK